MVQESEEMLLPKLQMQRSTSMPIESKPLKMKTLERSKENEAINDTKDFCAESIVSSNMETLKKDEFCAKKGKIGLNKPTELIASDLPQHDFDYVGKLRSQPFRLIEKNGRENILHRRIPEKSRRYVRDFVTTLIELDWKYMGILFIGTYFLTWIFFGILCYIAAYAHGDLFFDEVTGKRLSKSAEPCIVGVYDFLSMLIYSVEVQTTIGFGEKYPSEECNDTITLFIMQIICAIGIEGCLISVIYAKTSRPVRQLTKLKFSDKAVICYRDGKLCLLFRVCDPREQQTVESKIRVYMIFDKPTLEGENIKTYKELQLVGNGEQIIVWPETVCHVIDDTSPLRNFTNAKEFNAAQFELYVSIVGTSSTTAQVTEARTSYVPREIFWGQRFINVIHYDVNNDRYVIDYSNFNTTISVDMQNVREETEKLERTANKKPKKIPY